WERFKAREKILKHLEAAGLLRETEKQKHAVPYGDRSGTIIEPRLTDQWFVDAKKLAGPAIQAVESGAMQFTPKNWEKTYFEWMRNIQPWCISRQLWWGHQIPAWYGEDGHFFVARSEEEALIQAKEHYGKEVSLSRDPDVLDTWFSSALWPFSTLGWPEETQKLKDYYPTSLLTTSFDIIFFWVARMMMMGLHFTGQVPFKEVYIHALIRDAKGQKMSKSKGNVIDPLEIMDRHGTDAFRFSLVAFAAQGRDIKLSEERILGYRNFCNKIWNAARLVLSTSLKHADFEALKQKDFDLESIKVTHPISQWILVELSKCIARTRHALESYRFNEAAEVNYQFFWSTYCDWFLELIKPSQQSEEPQHQSLKKEFATIAVLILEKSLRLMHPMMPFLTEEIWQKLEAASKDAKFLMQKTYPKPLQDENNYAAEYEKITAAIKVIEKIRSIRMQLAVPLSQIIPEGCLSIYSNDQKLLKETIDDFSHYAVNLAKFKSMDLNNPKLENKKGVIKAVIDYKDLVLRLDLSGFTDLEEAKKILQKDRDHYQKLLIGAEKTLANPKFVQNADPVVVAETKDKQASYALRLRELEEALSSL
ncbi:MAG: class I tRNA ligase family protein, partial [Deltaproteobacteria bacterium]|nr:class I tRNA ligase family protein [Deltaproteobacteria bacterium]